jgi:hypothetical protein
MQINLIDHLFCMDDAYKHYGKSKERENKLTHLINNNKITFNHSEINTLYSVQNGGMSYPDFVFQNSSLSKTRFQTNRDRHDFPTIKLEGKVNFNQCVSVDFDFNQQNNNRSCFDSTNAKQIQMESCLFTANPNNDGFDTTKFRFIKSYYFNNFEEYILEKVEELELSEEPNVFHEMLDAELGSYFEESELHQILLSSLLKEGHIKPIHQS